VSGRHRILVIRAPLTGLTQDRYRQDWVDGGTSGAGTEEGTQRGRAKLLAYQRTEGWAAGLRLAAISLAGHPDPERFVAEFSGSERTAAEYLLAEMLDRQPDDVQDLLLRTCRAARPGAAAAGGGRPDAVARR
jgi:hypothetical protein